MTDLEKDILSIIKAHVGDENKLTQYEIAEICCNASCWNNYDEVSCRQVRNIIADLINQGYPIVSTPSNGGGYHWQSKVEEALKCSNRLRRQAVKLFIKARKIRANSRMGQLNLDIRV